MESGRRHLPRRETGDMDVGARIDDALSDEASRSYSTEYLSILTENWRELKTTVRKTLGLLLLAAGAFELIRSAQLTKATIAGLEISNFSNIEKLLPVVVAYLAFQVVVHHTVTVYYQRIHTRFHRILHPRLGHQELHVALRPSSNLWWEPSTLAYATGEHGRRARILADGFALATVLGVLAFELYAYDRLFASYGPDWLVFVSLALTALLLVRAAAELRLESQLG
jgi:hypothetical protein